MKKQKIKNCVRPKLFIVGNTSESYHLGSMLCEAAKENEMEFQSCDANYQISGISCHTVLGKIFYKILKLKKIKDLSMSRKIINKIKLFAPKLIIVTGILPLNKEVFTLIHRRGGRIVNYLTDDPWNKPHFNRRFLDNIHDYDIIFSTKKAVNRDLKLAGAKKVVFLHFGFDPKIHRILPKDNKKYSDVCFIGGADAQRAEFLEKFLRYYKGSFSLYGSGWFKFRRLKNYNQGLALGDDYCRTIAQSKINIGMVRRSNRDGHAMRSFEIAPCGGVGIYEDTNEHREILRDYPDVGFFKDPQDLAKKCNLLLKNSALLEKLRSKGKKSIVGESNFYSNRLLAIIKQSLL